MSRGFLLSCALHVALFLVVLVGPAPKPFEWNPRDAVAVDLVAPIPDVPRPEPKAARPERERPPLEAPVKETEVELDPEDFEPEPEEAPEEPPPDPPEPKPEPPKAEARPTPPREFRRVAPEKREEGPTLAERLQKRLEGAGAPPPPPAPDGAAAEESTPESAASDASAEALDFPYAWYLNLVDGKITDAWDTPGQSLLAGGRNRVLVRFRIHRDGRVSDVQIEKASGTPGLDASARRALERAQPFPPLPEGWAADHVDVSVWFTAEGRRS